MRLLRIFGASFSVSLRRELAFRTNLLFEFLMTAIGIASGLVALGVVYGQTQTLGGWTFGETIVLLGTYQILSGILATFIEPNLIWFADQVKSGKLDDVLLKPVSSLFLVSLGSCGPLALSQVLIGFVVLGVGVDTLGMVPSAWNLIGWLVLLVVGIAVTWASRVLFASIALWSPGFDLDVVYSALWQFGRYPISMYQQPIRFVFTWVLPVAFISTHPAHALTQGADTSLIAIGLALGLGAIIIVLIVWDTGLRRYTSATS